MTHNDLVAVEKSSLTKLPKLRQLILDHNKISYVEEGAFAHLPVLQTLYDKIDFDNNIHFETKSMLKFLFAVNWITMKFPGPSKTQMERSLS